MTIGVGLFRDGMGYRSQELIHLDSRKTLGWLMEGW